VIVAAALVNAAPVTPIPMPAGPAAPVAAMASAIIASISLSEACAGR